MSPVTEHSRPRLLLAAYQCGPGMGSVSEIGWQWYRRLSQRLPVTLVTHRRNRAALEAQGAPLGDSEIIYMDTEWFAGPVYRGAARLFPRSEHATFLLASVDFYLHDWCAYRLLRQRWRDGQRWDLVHAVTPVSPRASTHLHRLGIPLILGPWNGGLASPRGFPEIMREDASWLYPLRRLGGMIDLLVGAQRRAAMILIATRATREAIPRRYQNRCVAMLENAVDPERFRPAPWPPAPNGDIPLRVVFVGRLVPFKGLGMLLEALARCRERFPVHLDVVGDGPMRQSWEQQTQTLGLSEAVVFHGALPAPGVVDIVQSGHLFCLPSVRESGGAVLLEAMACARPVVALAHGGPAEIVDEAVGLALPASHREAVIDALVACFAAVLADPEDWRRRGEAGLIRARERFSWEAKIDTALRYYRDLLSRVSR